MPVFKEERILDLPVRSDAMPEPALGSPAYQPYPSPPALPSSGIGENNQSRRGLSNDELSKIAKLPGQQTGPNLIPLSEVVANKRYNTYVRGMDLENVYGLQQSWYSQLGNSAVKFAGLGVGTFLQSFASLPNTISAFNNGSVTKLSGQDGYESDIDNWVKNFEDRFPNYYTRRERENPFLAMVPFMPGSANFWGDGIFKNMGFMAGAIGGALVQDAIVGAFTEGIGAAPLIAAQLGKASLWLNKVFVGTNKLDNVLDAARAVGTTEKALLDIKKLGQVAEGIRIGNGVRYGLGIYSSARTEAAIESRDSYRVLKEELTKDYIRLNGEEPTGAALAEIEDSATAGMNTRFGVNMALLTLSNAVQFGNLFKSFTTTSTRGISGALTSSVDDIGKIGLKDGSLDVFEKVVSPTKVGRVWDSIKPTVKNIFTEGIYEEGGQFAAEKGVYDYYTRKYKNLYDPTHKKNWDGLTEVMSSTLKGMNEQFTSTEGIQSMIIGALTAGITSPIVGKIQKKMGVPSDEERLQSTLNTMNLYGLTGIISNQRDDALDAIGIATEMDEAVKSGDVFRFKNLKHDMFFNYVTSRIPTGMHDVTIEQLKMLKGLDKEEFEKTFGTDFNASNKKTVNEYVDALIIKANQIKDLSTSIDSTFRNPYRFTINPTTQEEATETSKHLTFNKWKKDLTYYASMTPELKGREMDIQQNLIAIDPRLSISLLKSVSDKDSIKEIANQYEEKAKQLGKTISDVTPVSVARKTREEMRYLRTLSEKINLAIGKQNIDEKLFNDVLNFELNGQNIDADKAVGSEKNNQLFTYGIDLNRIENLKRRVASLFEDLSSEEGFNKYFEQEEKMNEDLEKEGKKEPTKEPEEFEIPNVFQYENKQGEFENVELDRQYQIPPYKTARVSKIDEGRYQVEKPDGTLAFYNTQEDADAAVEEFNEQFRNLEKVKVVALNPDGTVKVEDAAGDVYDISLNKLKGYEKIKTEQEKLEKFKEEIENQQSEIEIDSSSVPSVEMDFAGLTDRGGKYKGDPLDFRKPWQWLYWSTTSASEDIGEDWKKPHSIRSITFLNNARNFKNRNRLRVMIVSAKQEDFLGLSGLTELSTGEALKRDGDGNVIVSDVENGFIAAVYIEQDGNQRWFVNEKGERIGKVGEKVDLNQVVFNTMPDTSLFWDLGGERYREKEEKEAKEMSARWSLKRAQLFDLPIDSPEIYTFDISRGIPVVDDINQKNHIGDVFLDENKVKTQEGLIVVSTKGTLSHNGQTYNIPVGRAMIQYQDVFEPAINNKFNKKQAEAIFEVMRLLAADIKRQADNNQKIVFNPFYADFLKNTLYWKKDDKTKKNQMYIDEKMNLFFAGKKYDITKLEDFKDEIIGDLLNAYHNVNNKYLATKEEGGVNKFHEPFVEYYFDATNKLQEREWTNYQSYLLSAKYPDGSSRNVEDTPVTTFVNKITGSTPYNFKQKYAILSPISFPALPVKQAEPAAPKGAVKAGKYNVGTTEAVENTFTGFSSAVGPVTFTARLNENNELEIEVVDDNTSNKAVANAKANEGVMSIIEKTLKDRFDVDNVDASVILFIREKIKADLQSLLSKKEEREEAPVKPTQAAVVVAPIRIGDVDFLPDNTSVYTSKKAFASGAPIQFRIESIDNKGYPIVIVSPEDQTSDTISQVAKNTNAVSQIDNFLKQINKFDETSSSEDRVALFASIRIYSNLKDQIDGGKKEAAPTPAVANVEQQRSIFSIFEKMFYEAQGKRGDLITDEQLAGLTPETKSYLINLYETLKPYNDVFQRTGKVLNPQNNREIVSNDDKIKYVTSMYFAGLGRPSTFLGSPRSPKHKDLVFPVPTASVLENLNTVLKASVSAEEISKSSSPAVTPTQAAPPIKEEPSAPKKKKGGKKHEDDDYSRFRTVGVKEKKKEKITEADIDVFKKWHDEKVRNLPYEISERIFMRNDGRRAYGAFADGVAKFYKGAIRGTEYHEVFEGIWSAFLTPEERQAILDELRAKSGTFTDRETGKKIRWDEATDNQIKERIADDFADYRLGKLPARSLLEKIVRFFRNIINYFRSIASKPSLVDELFNDIEAGRFAESVVPDSIKAQAPEYRAEEGLTETQTREYVEDMAALMFQYIFGTNKSLYDIQKITDVDLYNYVKGKYETSEKIDDTDPDFLSTNQFNGLFKKTIDFLRVFKIEFDVDSVGDINNDENDNRNYAPEPFSTDWKKTSPYPIKLLLGTLIQTKPSGKTTSAGIPMPDTKWSNVDGYKLVNFSRMFATSLEKLSNTTSIKDFIGKVFDMARTNTDYFRLLTRLKMNAETLNVDFDSFEPQDWRMFIQFYQTFTKQKPTAYIQYVSGGKTYIQAANLFTAAREVKDDWVSNMKVMSKLPDSIISYNGQKRTYQVKDVSKVPITTPEQMVDFLRNMGIEFPISTYNRLKTTPEVGEKSQQEQFINAVISIKTYLGKQKDLASITGKTLNVDRHIGKLAELYVLVENPPQETTRFNVEDQRVVEYTNNNYSSVFENEFNESETLEDLMAKRPELNDVFSASSLVLKKGGLFWNEDSTLKKKIKVGVVEGEKDIDSSKNTKTSSLGFGKRSVLELNNNLNGDYYILIPADASTEWIINLGNNISYKTVMGGKAFTKIHPIFRGYLDDEVNLAMSDRSYLELTAPRAQELRFFKEILPEDMVKKIHSLIKDSAPKSEIDKYINDNIDKVNSSIDSFIQTFIDDNMNDLLKTDQVVEFAEDRFSFSMLNRDFVESEDVKLDKDNLTRKELMDILTFANINYVINNIELHKILFGDPYQFKISGTQLDAVKRIKSFLSPRMTTFDTPELNTSLNQKYNSAGEIELEGRSAKKPFGDIGHHTFKSYINTVTLSDVKIRGTVYGNILETNETDGFSFMMDVVYRETKLKNGQWVEERAEPWHQWQMAYTRNRLAKRGIYEYTNPKLQSQDEITISKPAPKHMIEVLKPIVSGNKGNRNTIDLVLDKFSQMPLYYSMVEGTNLEEEYIKMWKGDVGYAVYESGRKVGVEETNSVYKKDGEFNTDPFKNIIQVPWKAYGIQVETAYDKFKEDVTRGSQPAKVVSIDLFDNGVPVSEAAKKEYSKYLLINDRLHKSLYEDLLQKLGLEDLGDSFFIKDRVALAKSLQNEIMRREFSSNVKDTVQLDKNGQFPIPFEASNAYKQIRDILFSMVHKSINSPKMHGGAYVQVPVTMFEKLGSSRSLVIKKEIGEDKFVYEKISKEGYQKLSEEEKKNVYLTDDTLKMPTKEDPYMEVMLPHWFREKLPKKLKGYSDKQLLDYLNNTKDGKELLQGVGFRIPTQALSSIAPIRVKGFLPQYAGYTVVVPSEITTMAGSDFDIDKLFMYLKSFYITENDEIALIRYYNNEQETKDFYRKVYDSTIQKKMDKVSEYDAFRNKLLDVFAKLDTIEQFDEAEEFSIEDLRVLGEETYDFATTHAEIINAIMDQADEANVSPTEYLEDQIKRLNNDKDKLTKELLNSQLKEDFVRKMHKRALENEYYKSMENMLTLPENYGRLMSVVDDAGLKNVARELDYLTGETKREKAIKNKLLSRSYMSRLRHSFVTAKRWVGIAAVNITGHSNAQKSPIIIDPSRFSRLNDFDKKIIGDGSIALPHNTYRVGNTEYVSISGIKTADGKDMFISSRLSGYATTFVDVAKDPYIMKIIKGDLAVGTFMFLERIGSGENVPMFMNQPIIANYLQMLDNVNARTLFSKKYIDLILSKFPTTNKAIEETQLDVSLTAMKDNIESYYENEGKMDDAYNAGQRLMFMEFLKYAKMAEYSFKLTQASNYDTTKFKSTDSLFRKQTRTRLASDKNIFSSVDEILINTQIGAQAYYLDRSTSAISEYLQLDKPDIRENINNVILEQYAENDYLSADKFDKMGMRVTASLLDFLLQTKTGLNEQINQLTTDANTSAAALLQKAKEKYPDDDLIQSLQIRQTIEGGAWTVKLRGNAKASAYDEDYYIGRMRELRDNPDTNELFRALVKLSILQGSYQSSVSIKNIIPVEDYQKEIGDVMSNLRYSLDMDAFTKGMFYRNQWKNEDVFKRVYPNFIPTGFDFVYEDDVLEYYRSESFPVINFLGPQKVGEYSNRVLVLSEKYNFLDTQSDFVLVDRFLKKPESRVKKGKTNPIIDIQTGEEYTDAQYRKMFAVGDPKVQEVYGYQKVRYSDGTPLVKYDADGTKSYVYKLINLYGDGSTFEYYNEFKKSVLENGTIKLEQEIPDDLLIEHFTSSSVNMKPDEGVIQAKAALIDVAPPPTVAPTTPVSGVEVETQLSAEPTTPPALEIGRYVKYKEGTYIVTKINDNGTYQIYNPTLEGASAKISVSIKNLTPLETKATIVQYRDGEYIVTSKNNIISLTTNKIMKWGDENGDRRAILTLAGKEVPMEVKEPAPSVAKEEIASSEDVSTTFTFKDGNKIETPFPLNAEQKEALYKMEEFIKDPSRFNNQVTLLGYAGTGKTTIIGLFHEYLKKKFVSPIYTSPTHRANAVTKQKNPSARVLTLHSLFGLGPDIKLEDGDYDIRDLEFSSQNKPKIQKRDLIIVDEASMVSNALYNFLENYKNQLGLRIIYIGDPAQLKPVKDKEISPVFRKGENIQLTKVERTGDNPILRESTDLRNNKDMSYVSEATPSGGVEYTNDSQRVNEIIGENFSSQQFADNKLYFRILSGTNAVVDEYNNRVRNLLFNTNEQLVLGDVLMGYNNFDVDYQTKEPLIINSGDYQVVNLKKSTKAIIIKGKSVEFSGYDVSLINLMNEGDAPKNLFIVDNAESKDKIFAFVDEVADFNKAGAIAKREGNMKLAANYFEAARVLESRIAFMKELRDANGKVKVKKTLGYGYAHTIHKSQGGTYNKVLILADTISKFSDPQTRQQLKYVAMSRASEFVYVVTSEVDFITTSEFTQSEKDKITKNFMEKHKVSESEARNNISKGFIEKRKEAIELFKKCYL